MPRLLDPQEKRYEKMFADHPDRFCVFCDKKIERPKKKSRHSFQSWIQKKYCKPQHRPARREDGNN